MQSCVNCYPKNVANYLNRAFENKSSRKLYREGLLFLTVLLALGALLLPIALRPNALPIEVGDVATRDIVAPYNDTYISDVLTEKARDEAVANVAPRYLPSDPSINRTQLDILQKSLDFMTSVRNDTLADKVQQLSDLTSITFIPLSEDQASEILLLQESQWDVLQEESMNVLEQTMRKTIRETQIQDSINNIPSLINYALPVDQADLVEAFVTPLIVANSLFSETETAKAKEEAARLVDGVTKTYAANQTIVLRGQIISAEQWEALNHFDLIRPNQGLQEILATTAITLTLTGFVVLYFKKRRVSSSITDLRNLTVIAFGFLLFLYAAKVIIPNRTIMPYFFPLSAYALILATLFNFEISLVFSLVLSILVTHGVSNSVELTIFYVVTSILSALALGKGKKFADFLWAGVVVAVSGILVITAYRLLDMTTDLVGILTLFGATVLNGFATASLALLLQTLLAQFLGIPTPMLLIELSRSDHPLLKQILQRAPGSYQHSLLVANLAEQAAEAIGADALLTRVGAMYHDAGKSVNPYFFIENQVPGNIDTHDDMDPIIAAQTIIQHVQDGLDLADKHRLPPRLKDFIREHHGSQITRYQYNRAVEQQGKDTCKVDLELFRYPGPKPQTKETGILMLADGCEARAKSDLPKNEEQLRALIKKVFDYVIGEGLLENTNLSLRDLKQIRESFYNTLSTTYHARIQYPEIKPPTTESTPL